MLMSQNNKPKFNLGQRLATPGALEVLNRSNQSPSHFFSRHQCGDWGDICQEDAQRNDEAVKFEGDLDKQERVFSVYKTLLGDVVWVITEYDRSATTILLPSEY